MAQPKPSRTVISPGPRWATMAEAAEYSGLAIRTIRDWISRGWLPGYRLGPRQVRIDINDIDSLLKRIPTRADA